MLPLNPELESHWGQDLTVLPPLSPGAVTLECSHNRLTELPELPKELRTIACNDNRLARLPELPRALVQLSCSDNQLTALPTLPDTLVSLKCHGNPLTLAGVPMPQSLERLQCDALQLVGAELPASLRKLHLGRMDEYIMPRWPELPNHMNDVVARVLVPLAKDTAAQQLLDSRFDGSTSLRVLRALLAKDAAFSLTRWHRLADLLHLLPDAEHAEALDALASVDYAGSMHAL